jgi:hypothetical protein
LSLISMLITWTGLLNSPPRVRRSSRLRQKIFKVAVLSMLTVADGIKTSFFASYHNISYCFALLPSLRCQLDVPIPIKHWKEPVCCVSATALLINHEINGKTYLQTGVFRAQLFVYGVVWCTKWIYVRFIDRWAWKPDSRTCPV